MGDSSCLISAQRLLHKLQGNQSPAPGPGAASESRSWRVLDCGFDLFDPAAGERAWAIGHIPGALYAHLDRDLSAAKSPRGPVEGGRHPLPSASQWRARVAAWGITPETPVVVYDDQGGAYAARAWWMLRWMGHEAVWVLDGGKAAWVAAGGGLEAGAAPPHEQVQPPPQTQPQTQPQVPAGPSARPASPAASEAPVEALATMDAATLARRLGQICLVDARAGERYRGETEPLDTRAGHIPGAVNRFFKDNLGPDGRFKSPEQLRAEWLPRLPADADASQVVHQCGSGVTACHNLLALCHAGLGLGVLYPGSWSEWSADPSRPVALG